MWVENFTRLKRPIWNRSKTTVDKKLALLDLMTGEKGFEFKADGQQPAETEEGDGVITVKLPDKTRFVTIKHPDYGQRTWRVPVKHLKRKKHYRATLQTVNAEKEYQLQRQWVVFNVSPENAILRIDSTMTLLREPSATFFLPIGSHSYQVESPFYEAVKDSFLLTDTAKEVITVSLQPVYSYLTVKTPWESCDIRVDGQSVGWKEATSKRLGTGTHRLSVFMYDTCYYDTSFDIGPSEKKVVCLTADDMHPLTADMQTIDPQLKEQSAAVSGQKTGIAVEKSTQVTLKATDEDTEIWVDREKVGKGQWNGLLAQGYHLITTRKDGVESLPIDLWLTDDFPQEVNLDVPQTSQGMLNIYSNVVGANIYINKVYVGKTPSVIRGLSSSRVYDICLQKAGYKDSRKTVRPKSNDLVDFPIVMKKSKK